MDPGILGALPWSTITPSGLLALVFMLVMLGFLVPKSYYQEALRERDHWREAHNRSEAARAKAILQNGVLVNAVDRLSGERELGVRLMEEAVRKAEAETEAGGSP